MILLFIFTAGCFSKPNLIDRENRRFHSEEIGLTLSFSPQWVLLEEKNALFAAEFRPNGTSLARLTVTEERDIPRLEDFIALVSLQSISIQTRLISQQGEISQIHPISSQKKEIKGTEAWEAIWSAERKGVPKIFHSYMIPAELRLLQFHFEFPEAAYIGHQQVIKVVLDTISLKKGKRPENKEYARVYRVIGEQYKIKSLWKEAIASFERAISYRPKEAELYILLGESYLKDEQIEPALRAYSDAARHDPQNAKAYAGLADVYFKKGLHDQGVSAYKRAIGLAPENEGFYLKLGEAYMASDRNQEAANLYQKMLRRHPTSAEGHLGLGKAYLAMSLYEEAILEFEKVAGRSPKGVEAHCLLEKAYTELGSTSDAEKQKALCKPEGAATPAGT